MIRSALLMTLGVVATTFFSFWAVAFSFFNNAENNVHKVANIWARIMLLISGTSVEVIGAKYVLRGKPQVFMANHQSDFDILITLAYLPGQFRWIAKKEFFAIPVFGRAMKAAGYVEIDRQNHEKALQSLDIAAQRLLRGKSVMTFPEGTRSRNGEIKAFKSGAFYLAIQSGVPIVPISIIGSGVIMPKLSLKTHPGKIRMVIGKPIDSRPYPIEQKKALIKIVRDIIKENYNKYHYYNAADIRDIHEDEQTTA